MQATETDIKTTRERARYLAGRVEALTAQRSDAAKNEAGARGRFEEARAGLTDGKTGPDDVARTQRNFDEATSIWAHVQAALDQVKGELVEATNAITAYDSASERERQNEAADELRERAQEQLDAFGVAFAGLRGTLLEFGRTCREIEERFPLATPVAPLTMDALGGIVREHFHVNPTIESREMYQANYVRLVHDVLTGPFRDAAEFNAFKQDARIGG